LAARNAGAAKTRSATSGKAAATSAATAAAFGGENHLQKLVRIFQKIFELVALRAENFCCELRSDLHACDRRVFRDISDLVNLDAGFTG